MKNVTLGFRGVEMVVEYDYTPELRIPLEGINDPDEFKIRSVLIEGEEWINLLTDEALTMIEEEIRTPVNQES